MSQADETPSGRSSPTSTGRSSPTNDASDDPAAAISRIASLFQSLNRLRDAGYGSSVIAAKVAECRAAVVSLPPDLQAQVVALVNAIDDELEGDDAAPVDDVDEIPFGLLDLPPPVLALCCVFAGDSGSLVPRLARTCRAGGGVKPEIMQSLYAVGTRVVLHGLQADTLNLRRGTVVQCATAEDRVGVRLDGEVKPKSVRRVNVCVEINQRVGCIRQFFTKSFLGDDAAMLAPSSGEEPASPRHRAGVASMAWTTTRCLTNAP